MKIVELHCDGYSHNGNGKSGAGVVLVYNNTMREWVISLGIENTFRAELLAIIHGLNKLKEPCEVHIFSDNQVAIFCITGQYKRKSNLDLWDMYEDAAKDHVIIAEWNAVNSTEWNTKANELARLGAKG